MYADEGGNFHMMEDKNNPVSLSFTLQISTSRTFRIATVHHALQVENNMVPEAVPLCLQMGTHQREGQAPHAQPSHQ